MAKLNFCKAVFIAVISVLLYGIYAIFFAGEPDVNAELEFAIKDGYFGRSKKRTDDPTINPFKINVSSNILEDLKVRLQNARIGHEQLEDVLDFEYGFNLDTLQKWRNYWLNDYDWRKNEAILNTFSHFITEIEGLKIHFLHVKPPNSHKYRKIIPLLMIHGWPGSFFEFYKIIPLLTNPQTMFPNYDDIAFEVIVPSIPGYGWSEQPHKRGFNMLATARVFNKLMAERLGFKKYMAQGGDWGSAVASSMARMYPENLNGIHLNFIIGQMNRGKPLMLALIGTFFPRLVFSQQEYSNINMLQMCIDILKEVGYMTIQATKPDTVGVGLNDSPVGLLAYILEKFSTWTNVNFKMLNDGGLEKKFTKDELLTNLMIYWTNGNILSSQRYYKENFGETIQKLSQKYVSVPTAYADCPNEFFRLPIEIAKSTYNITQVTSFKQGGHFAAFEIPRELAEDIFKFAKSLSL